MTIVALIPVVGSVAVIVVADPDTAVETTVAEPAVTLVMTFVLLEDQVTVLVRSFVPLGE